MLFISRRCQDGWDPRHLPFGSMAWFARTPGVEGCRWMVDFTLDVLLANRWIKLDKARYVSSHLGFLHVDNRYA